VLLLFVWVTMSRFARLCALLLVTPVLSVAQTPSAPASLPPLAHAKLSSCDGLPCVDAVLGGKHVRLSIDIGDPSPVLNLKVARALGLTLQPIAGADGKPVEGYQKAVVNNVAVGGVKFDELKFLVIDLSSAINDKTFPDVDGTLGYKTFENRILQLDYPAGVFGLSQPLTTPTGCPGFCGDISFITFGHKGPPIVTTTGFTVNGKPIAVQVDTLFAGTLLIYPTSVEKLGMTTESQSKTSKYISFTDGGVDMFQSQAKQVGFGSKTLATDAALYFAGPKVHLPDGLFDGTVGADVLEPYKVTFDFHDNKFWLD
jgi:Aspartyl protease